MGINLGFKSTHNADSKITISIKIVELAEFNDQDTYNPGIRIQGNFDVSTVLVFI
jgi:hypothetical protein